ncbi:MAG: hypothetical protein JNM36_10540, partial [Chitinophagales bacterium]|nr:hypothetical protein [Chitinophagales bacterium]
KRVRDVAGGVSQCVACEAPKRQRSPEQPDPQGTPKKNNVLLSDYLTKIEQ